MQKLILFFLLIIFSVSICAQNRVVHGVVNMFDSIPLIGVEIKIQSTKQVITTDTLGRFTAFCEKKDKLKLKAESFYPQTVKVPENVKLLAVNMKLKPGDDQLDYAIGYGYISEKNRTTAISNLQVKSNDYAKFNSVSDILRSMGVQVVNGEVVVRGTTSFQGSSAALIVINDVISDYDMLHALKPIDIKRINILKDAAASIYGSRGTNGVVLVETVKGSVN